MSSRQRGRGGIPAPRRESGEGAVLKAFAALLSYPDEHLQEALGEIRSIVAADRRITRADRARVEALIQTLEHADLLELQEQYVALFDRGRATSLNLYEHVHGDSRDRGQAMVDLVDIYQRGGLQLSTRELPDHLPVLLEYLSTRPYVEVREMLVDCAHLLRAIGDALVKRQSPYAAILGALLEIAGEDALAAQPQAADENDSKTLDEEWVEAPVLFGLGCGDARDNNAAAKPIRFVKKGA
ncbi:MAG TPA: nitrate reductase molybdenum cofactor assembly chaperone [Casimicrobiaceae bacterium]|nr:nitrate reductase molybdenum cofactor assembly chaperone [Casimicrobiaceae bacterium]